MDQIPHAANLTSEERNFSVAAHLGAFAFFLFPLGNIVAPLLLWLFKRRDSRFIEQHALEALNFQISMTLYGLAASLLILIVIGFALLAVLTAIDLGLAIFAALHASRGELYRYPFTLRLIS
jgi:hypothetical protein